MALNGKETKAVIPQFFVVRNKGFASLYGMLLLSIILFFVSMITSRIHSFAYTQKLSLSDVYVLHHINRILSSIEAKDDNNEEDTDAAQDEKQTIEEFSFHEFVNYQGCEIPIVYNQNTAKASVLCNDENYEMYVHYDIKNKSIQSYEYNTNTLEE